MTVIDEAGTSTPEKDLEDRIMNPNVAKSEAEWWAHHVIFDLRSALAATPPSERERELEGLFYATEERAKSAEHLVRLHADAVSQITENEMGKTKKAVSERDEARAQLAQMREAAQTVIAYDHHGRLIAAKDGEGDQSQNVIFAGEVVELDRLYDVMLAATQKALTSTEATTTAFVEGIKREALATDAARDVMAERQRQKDVEGWTEAHDDEHERGAMSKAAACYALEATKDNHMTSDADGRKPVTWPWDSGWWKPSHRRRNLVKAGALILAEIERLDRAAIRNLGGE